MQPKHVQKTLEDQLTRASVELIWKTIRSWKEDIGYYGELALDLVNDPIAMRRSCKRKASLVFCSAKRSMTCF